MSQNSLVVPVRIVLEKQSISNFFDFAKSGLYNDKGEAFLLLKGPEPKPIFNNHEGIYFSYWAKDITWDNPNKKDSTAHEYTDNLFSEQINITTIDEAYAFLNKYPYYLFVLPELLSGYGYSNEFGKYLTITKNDFLEVMLNRIQDFHHMHRAYRALVDYYADTHTEVKVRHAFQKCLDYFNSQHSTHIIGISDDAIKNPNIKTDGEEAFIMLNGRTEREINRLTLSRCKDYIYEKIKAETRGVFIEQCIDDFAFEYHCPTLSAAMYEKMLLSAFTKDEYRQCAKCSAYFKVDKNHPQTLCDKHMAARRRKRQNAKAKEKAEEAASWGSGG